MIEVRKRGGKMESVCMGCKQKRACKDNKAQNFGRFWQCRPKATSGPSVCRQWWKKFNCILIFVIPFRPQGTINDLKILPLAEFSPTLDIDWRSINHWPRNLTFFGISDLVGPRMTSRVTIFGFDIKSYISRLTISEYDNLQSLPEISHPEVWRNFWKFH